MNSPSDIAGPVPDVAPHIFCAAEKSVAPFEFRMLSSDDALNLLHMAEAASDAGATGAERPERNGRNGYDLPGREAALAKATEAARHEGFADGEREGRKTMKAELDAQFSLQVAREREQVSSALEAFRGARERYFATVEQEVVKLALAIAARVLHRETQLDPLLLAGAVRVALEKMADRSSVVMRVAAQDADAWERALGAMQPHERPKVAEDSRLERGECVLETTMGTVELGVQVQLEEIEKGFFDLLSKRPTE